MIYDTGTGNTTTNNNNRYNGAQTNNQGSILRWMRYVVSLHFAESESPDLGIVKGFPCVGLMVEKVRDQASKQK